MKTRAGKSSYFDRAGTAGGVIPLLITGIAVILFSTAGIARMMGWGSNWTDYSGGNLELDQTALAPTASDARARPRCPECGVIVAVREIERHDQDSAGAASVAAAGNPDETPAKSTRNYEIIVRMADGSSRVFDDANPARWRTGERLIVIAGTDPLRQ